MQSPFLDEQTNPAPQSPQGTVNLDQLDELIKIGVQAKKEAERQKAIYDSVRDQVCAMLRDLGETKVETTSGKARLKETKSGWQFSPETINLAEQVKLQQDIEKRTGVATPTKFTLSADLFS